MNIYTLMNQIDTLKSMDDNGINDINKIIENNSSPIKEFLYEYSKFGKLYSVNKDNRGYLIINYDNLINQDIFDNRIKTIIIISYIDAQYKNYNYYDAEEKYNLLKNYKIEDYKVMIGLSEYTLITRRYDETEKYLLTAKKICNDNYYLGLIDRKLEELIKKRNGKGYFPATIENKEKYIKFMDYIGMSNKLPKEIAKQPDKIADELYPQNEYERTFGFSNFVAFDLETTGFDSARDSITEIGAIKIVDGKVIETKNFIFQELVHPYKRKIPKVVENVTGITNEMVKDSREVWEVFNDFADFIGDNILVGYNCNSFDSKFLRRAGILSNKVINNKYFDLMIYVRNLRLGLNDNKLNTVAGYLGITNPQAHRALADAITTAKIYIKLLEMTKR